MPGVTGPPAFDAGVHDAAYDDYPCRQDAGPCCPLLSLDACAEESSCLQMFGRLLIGEEHCGGYDMVGCAYAVQVCDKSVTKARSPEGELCFPEWLRSA